MLIVSDRKLLYRVWLVFWIIILSIFEIIFVIEFLFDIIFFCNGIIGWVVWSVNYFFLYLSVKLFWGEGDRGNRILEKKLLIGDLFLIDEGIIYFVIFIIFFLYVL